MQSLTFAAATVATGSGVSQDLQDWTDRITTLAYLSLIHI